jgi:enoyl-CoA hydratase
MTAAFNVELTGHIAEVTLLGPGKGNAMGPDFWADLPAVARDLDTNPDVRVVILRGSGSHFSFGLDLQAMLPRWQNVLAGEASAGPRTEFLYVVRSMQDSISAIANIRKPVIAAVEGWCVGGGVDLIAACDIRLASRDAKFSIREARLAIVADVGSLQRLSGIISEGHLRELAYTARDFDAAYAERINLVNRVADDVHAEAKALAEEIAAVAPLAVYGTKEALDLPRRRAIDDGLKPASIWSAAFLPSKDLNEAVMAFMQKRPAEFKGE